MTTRIFVSLLIACAANGLWGTILPAITPEETFAQRVSPFFARHCVGCHGETTSEMDVRLDLGSVDEVLQADPAFWRSVLHQLALGSMPPAGEPRPSTDEVREVANWLRSFVKLDQLADDPKQLPGFGNYVDHELLFTEPAVRKAASPARLWRINPYMYREAVNQISGKKLLVVKKNQGSEGLHPALPFMTPTHTFRDVALPHRFEEATTELLLDMSWLVAGYQTDDARRLKQLGVSIDQREIAREEITAVIQHQFGLVLQRDPQADELQRLLELALETQREAGPREALQTVLAAVLMMPEAVFRIETGGEKVDEHGRARLTPREIAFGISYALTDLPPDQTLREALAEGRLDSADDVRREVRRMLQDERLEKPRILRFFREYFEYTRVMEIFKDGRIRKHYCPEQMVDDADQLVLAVLADDVDVLKRLLTTNEYFINVAENGKIGTNRPDRRQNRYYTVYNLDENWQWQADQPIAFPAEQRSGMLTHPAWLMSFSDNEKNQAIQRGRWVRMKLLGGTVPDVPIGVNAQLPTDPTLTLREKMHVTREDYCWRCHERMDPLGLPFEQFDDFGIYRQRELDRLVDTTGDLVVGDAELDGPIEDPFQYMQRLADARRVRQVFTRHAFRYWMGRNETLDDAPTLIDAEQAYTAGGGSMNAMITSLLSSDSFLFRRQGE